jgi:hypothetical protein
VPSATVLIDRRMCCFSIYQLTRLIDNASIGNWRHRLAASSAGFLYSLYLARTNGRLSVSQRERWVSGVHHSIPAAQRTAERDAVFRFVPEQTGGAVRPQATLKAKHQEKSAIQRNQERKRNLPPLQHTHPHAQTTSHTAHPKHFFGAAKRKYLAFARCRGPKPPHGGPRVRPMVNSPCVRVGVGLLFWHVMTTSPRRAVGLPHAGVLSLMALSRSWTAVWRYGAMTLLAPLHHGIMSHLRLMIG